MVDVVANRSILACAISMLHVCRLVGVTERRLSSEKPKACNPKIMLRWVRTLENITYNYYYTTRGGGCLGSHIDEERRKLR